MKKGKYILKLKMKTQTATEVSWNLKNTRELKSTYIKRNLNIEEEVKGEAQVEIYQYEHP